jgi:hypothetical protein
VARKVTSLPLLGHPRQGGIACPVQQQAEPSRVASDAAVATGVHRVPVRGRPGQQGRGVFTVQAVFEVAEGGGFEPPRDVTPNTDSSRAP